MMWMTKNAFLFDLLIEYFHFSNVNAVALVEIFMASKKIKFRVLKEVMDVTGLQVDQNVLRDLESDEGLVHGRSFDSQGFIFEESDLIFQERIKNLGIIDLVTSFISLQKGIRFKQNYSIAMQYFLRALDATRDPLAANPSDCSLALLQADVCHEIWKLLRRSSQSAAPVAKLFSVRTDKLYRQARSSASPVFQGRVALSYAKFLAKANRLYECEKLLRETLEQESASTVMKEEMVGELKKLLQRVEEEAEKVETEILASTVGGASAALNSARIDSPTSRRKKRNSLMGSANRSQSQKSKLAASIRKVSRLSLDFASSAGGIFDSAQGTHTLVGDDYIVDDLFITEDDAKIEIERNKLLLNIFDSFASFGSLSFNSSMNSDSED
jgi:hypothetical protein